VREFPLGHGFGSADYLLYVDGRVVDFVTRETPTRGREMTLIQSIFNAVPGQIGQSAPTTPEPGGGQAPPIPAPSIHAISLRQALAAGVEEGFGEVSSRAEPVWVLADDPPPRLCPSRDRWSCPRPPTLARSGDCRMVR
jgi:hypothetical protein